MSIADGTGVGRKIPTNNLTGRRCSCGNCGELFNSIAAFEKHRTLDPKSPTGRGCKDEMEMLCSGMQVNLAGYWVTEVMPEATFGGDEDVADWEPTGPLVVIETIDENTLPVEDDPEV